MSLEGQLSSPPPIFMNSDPSPGSSYHLIGCTGVDMHIAGVAEGVARHGCTLNVKITNFLCVY